MSTPRGRMIGLVILAALGSAFLGVLWRVPNPLVHRSAAHASRDVDPFGPCDGVLVPPPPFLLSTPLETVALREDGRDIWRAHAKFQMSWNFAENVSLYAIDTASNYVHDLPATLDLAPLAGRGLTLVIGYGNSEVEMACDNP